MSNGKVKRWKIKATKWDNPKAEWRFHDSEGPGFPGYDSPPPCIKVMRVEDHERIVAELKAELDERTEQLETTMERYRAPARTIATQRRVIEKLREQRDIELEDNCWDDALTGGRPFEQARAMMDAEIEAIEKGS